MTKNRKHWQRNKNKIERVPFAKSRAIYAVVIVSILVNAVIFAAIVGLFFGWLK